MRTLTALPAAIAIAAGLRLHAQDSGFGLGFVLGDPTGISFKGWVAETRAVDGAIAWSLGDHDSFNFHVDYLFHSYNAITVSKGRLPLYYGPGLRMRFWEHGEHWHHGEWHHEDGNVDLGVRFPVGLCYQFADAPLDTFLEIAPVIGIVPSTYFDMDGGLGLRYWF